MMSKLVSIIKDYLYEKRYTIEGVQKVFKEKGLKNLLGEEIQKDFFKVPEEPLNEQTQEFLSSLQQQLKNMRQELTEAIEKV